MKSDEPQRADAVKLVVNEAFDIAPQLLGLLAILLLHRGHLSFYCYFSREAPGKPFRIQHISSVELIAAELLKPPSKHFRQSSFMQAADFTGSSYEDVLTLQYPQAKPTRATLQAGLFLLLFSCITW